MRRVLRAVAVGTLLLAACGSSNKVGDKSLLNFQSQANERLGGRTPTPPPAVVTPAPAQAQGSKQVITNSTPTPKVITAEQIAITININSDNAGTTNFDPSVARVFSGSQVRWINKDSIARSVESDTDAFTSGSIKPGGEWIYQFKSAGKFNYHDGTRPYAVAAIEVLNK